MIEMIKFSYITPHHHHLLHHRTLGHAHSSYPPPLSLFLSISIYLSIINLSIYLSISFSPFFSICSLSVHLSITPFTSGYPQPLPPDPSIHSLNICWSNLTLEKLNSWWNYLKSISVHTHFYLAISQRTNLNCFYFVSQRGIKLTLNSWSFSLYLWRKAS